MIDLHLHTTNSDGASAPAELVELLSQSGVTVAAITDHDTVSGWKEFEKACLEKNIRPICGVELSAKFQHGDCHFLGYGVDPNSRVLLQHLDWILECRNARNENTVIKLNQMGLKLRWDEVEKAAGGGIVGRPHIARALVHRGYVSTVKEAFDRYLTRSRPAYIPRRTLDPEACIELIYQAGGLSVLAHPKTIDLPFRKLKKLISYFADEGLNGLEVYYVNHDLKEIHEYKRIAEKNGLYATGGSDFHGSAENADALGHRYNGRDIRENDMMPFLAALDEVQNR